jgi:Uri superfamily endonuclease
MTNLTSIVRTDLSKRFGVTASNAAIAITTEPGAYLIQIEITDAIFLSIASLPKAELSAGHYVYAGSARGPGGLRARIARHLRRGKRRHWHIDHLTEEARSLFAFPVPGGSECKLVQSLVESGHYHQPLPGFGSSDCRHCVSHLLEAQGQIIGEAQCR